jgi:hypothetical protein
MSSDPADFQKYRARRELGRSVMAVADELRAMEQRLGRPLRRTDFGAEEWRMIGLLALEIEKVTTSQAGVRAEYVRVGWPQ